MVFETKSEHVFQFLSITPCQELPVVQLLFYWTYWRGNETFSLAGQVIMLPKCTAVAEQFGTLATFLEPIDF
jgi:hypothetical protein